MSTNGFHDGIHWGRRRENGVWLATRPRWRLMHPLNTRGFDSLYVAAWRFRLRLVVRNLERQP